MHANSKDFEAFSPFAKQVSKHLSKFAAAPILFVGSGVSRRYLDAPDWRTLLEQLAGLTDHDYSYYRSTASDNPPAIAQLLVEPLKERLWRPDQAELRHQNEQDLLYPSSALKIYISENLKISDNSLPSDPSLLHEMELLRNAKIDAIITTNYDSLMERIFEDFKIFVGQDELVLSEPTGIGEIYKIHGSTSDINSLVFTQSDYEIFEERNVYLAAKLLTFFSEHPIIFLGYGFNDPDVSAILASLAKCLTDAKLSKFQDRLLFVNWQEGSEPSMVGTVMAAGLHSIPVHTLTVPDYLDIFTVLAAIKRKFPARTLRHLKERIYSLVLDEEAQDRLHVSSIDADGNEDLVLGVGVIAELQKHGYKGVNRTEICLDVLESGDFEANYIVKMTLPDLLSRPGNFPMYKYLKASGHLDQDGRIKDTELLLPKLSKEAATAPERLRPVPSVRKRAVRAAKEDGNLVNMIKNRRTDETLTFMGAFSKQQIDLPELQKFLIEIRDDQMEAGKPKTNFAKAICIYDLLKYGPNDAWSEALI